MSMIRLAHISKTYAGTHKAVDNLDWEIEEGTITGFIGPNGAGKTTTLKMITGILEPDEDGSIEINGIDIGKNPVEAKRQFGFVSDSPDNFLRLKGIEYLNFMADLYDVPTKERKERIASFASRFEMENALKDRILSYSHGMRQKIMVMGALLHNPSVWILDEPLTGLDPKSAFALKEMMKEHAAAGKSVLFSTHVLEVAEKLCDRIAVINKGKIVYRGTLDDLRKQFREGESLEEIFLSMTKDA
ncbi:ABC transporter ATP-binding protein [Cuneatibacter sp. NSJ-177]|uniref:ABC transporter ATP-binding protein n=1 Tax=Cuneatibacter sp. NSJ-177 TaxID=2931401 RepID=UPI002ED63E58